MKLLQRVRIPAPAVLAALLPLCAAAEPAARLPDFAPGLSPAVALQGARRAAAEDRTPLPAAPAERPVGFETGNDFSAVRLRGEITVSCSDPGRGQDISRLRCQEEILEPAEFVRLLGPAGVDADQVALTARWESGKTRSKTGSYDGAAGRSGRFNLWISTLLQRPLLDYGVNQLGYVLKKGGRPVSEGAFTAVVRRGEQRLCRRHRWYHSSDPSDCRAGASRMCDRYFADEDYCR